jgi:hypothetical protein
MTSTQKLETSLCSTNNLVLNEFLEIIVGELNVGIQGESSCALKLRRQKTGKGLHVVDRKIGLETSK